MKIVFFGSDHYSQIVLNVLKKDQRLKILQIIDNREKLDAVLKLATKPEVGVLASFGVIIPSEILNFPRMGILNVHPSLLPKYRGATPVPSAILAGEKQTGVTIIKLDKEVDHGPIVAQTKEEVRPGDTARSLLERLFAIGAKMLIPILPNFVEGKIELCEQDHSMATFTKRFSRENGQINWQKSPEYLERFIRAMFPWPGAFTYITLNTKHLTQNTRRLKILKAHLKVLSVKSSVLCLDEVQLEGKKPVSWEEFQRGYPKFTLG